MQQAVVRAYYSQVPGSKMSRSDEGYIVPCDSDLPDLDIFIEDYTAVIPGDLIRGPPVRLEGRKCGRVVLAVLSSAVWLSDVAVHELTRIHSRLPRYTPRRSGRHTIFRRRVPEISVHSLRSWQLRRRLCAPRVAMVIKEFS